MFRLFLLISIFLSTFLTAQTDTEEQLHLQDVPRVMQQMLSQHLDQQSISPEIMRRALSSYIDHFDPERIYVLDSEVKPYQQLSNADLEAIIAQYKTGHFDAFFRLNDTIQKAIVRQRELRKQIEQNSAQLFQIHIRVDPGSSWEDPDLKRPFAANDHELLSRVKRSLIDYIDLARKRLNNDKAINQSQIMAQIEKSLRERENLYLYRNTQDQMLSAVDQESLFAEHLLKALANGLDAHTTFYSPSEAYNVKARLQKAFDGVGIALNQHSDGSVVISGLTPQGPAERSGQINVGDRLVAVDGHPVADESLEAITAKMHGAKGSELSLAIVPNSGPDSVKTVVLKRAEITLQSDRVDVSSRPFGDGVVGIITLHSFYQGANGVSSESDVKLALDQLKAKGQLRGLILDLRENSGGFLGQAVKVAGLFITNGVVVIAKYFNGEQHLYRDLDGKSFYDGPLVVLTSRATASAAEIVAQALQDYGVAVIVGDEQTYGKGTIQNQTVTDNHNTSFFKVTVGRYYTVSGKTPQFDGVKADIVVPGIFAFDHIGERYLTSTVPADTIPEDFNDDLSDVSPGAKAWFLRYYMPTLQHKSLKWQPLLTSLKARSEQRIMHNPEYKRFLNNLKKGFLEAGQRTDFQLDEAVIIVEEMANSQKD